MAKSRKPARLSLKKVNVGDVFAIPLPDGRYGACRVLRVRDDPPGVLVAASPWVGAAPPDVGEPLLRTILNQTHHSWDGRPCVGWVDEPVPAEFLRVGTLAPAKKEGARHEDAADWASFAYQVHAQWRWDHERDRVLAEEEAERQRQQAAQESYRRAYKPLPARSFEEIRKRPFKGWETFVDSDALRASRAAVRETINTLLALGPDAAAPLKMNLLHGLIEQFNAIDDGWISTIEREDICELVYELADLVGLEDYEEALTSRRDW